MIRKLRLLPAAVFAIALLATPVQALARHRPAERGHEHPAAHRHARHRAAHAPGAASVNAAPSANTAPSANNGPAGNAAPSANAGPSANATLSAGAGAAVGTGNAVRGALSPGARHPTAHSASDTTVTIADFQFAPATITIHVGDTVTWVNNGPSAHTATAKDGSFNTGVLPKGHSASHTFTKAGTFNYICSIHPFMHGTVVVLADTTSTTTTPATTPTTTTPASTTPTPTSTSTTGELPSTGFAVTAIVLAGLLMTGVGLALRRRARV